MAGKISVFWFRRDLRIDDNTGFQNALKGSYPVITLFIFDQNIIEELPKNDARISFIYKSLQSLNENLIQYGSTLKILKGYPLQIWKMLINEYDIDAVYVNRDYEPYARNRDLEVEKLLNEYQIKYYSFKDQVIFEADDIIKKDGYLYTVFTPYKNKWREEFHQQNNDPVNKIKRSNFKKLNSSFPTLEELGFRQSKISVKDFQLSSIGNYSQNRNFPALDDTSYLGPHLRFGTVSIRAVISKLSHSDGVFLDELIWREFFMQILYHFPRVVDENFNPKYNGITWRNDNEDFQTWCQGKTGYPMVDAGMRQLNETGYMHNRVRMITAGFLCKHLLIDWRWGESYFAKKLLDYELSSNNGNWQWAAGTGCDAAPYFRIFNPYEQQKKFDKDFKYVMRWIPEFGTDDYPKPIIEHKRARERCLETYRKGMIN
jgi:deoxyribodipyrimidine photo-lyase